MTTYLFYQIIRTYINFVPIIWALGLLAYYTLVDFVSPDEDD